jgi:hypothetical protein
MLQRIKQRPGMFLGNCPITRLRAFLDGYLGARADLGLPLTQQEQEFNQFQDWIQAQFQITSSQGWDRIILFYSADEQDALNHFFELFEKFKNRAIQSESSEPNLSQEIVSV